MRWSSHRRKIRGLQGDSVIQKAELMSFRDPREGALGRIVYAGSIEEVASDCVAFLVYKAGEHAFIDSQRRSLSAHLDGLPVFNIIAAESVFLAAQKVG